MSPTETKTSPVIIIAAIALIIFSLVGIGTMTGVIPSSFLKSGQSEIANQGAEVKPASSVNQPTTSSAGQKSASHPTSSPTKEARRVANNEGPGKASTAAAAANLCGNCGVVQSVSVTEQKGESSGMGMVAGGVAGAVLGNQVGQGRGKDLATIAGAAGGAYAGNEIEKNMKKIIRYNVVVRLDDGTTRTIVQQTDPGIKEGDKVKIVDGTVVRN